VTKNTPKKGKKKELTTSIGMEKEKKKKKPARGRPSHARA